MTASATRIALVVLVVLGVGVALVIARAGPDPTVASAHHTEIVMEEYRFVPDEVVVPAEQPVTLRFVNRDEASHHVAFGRSPVTEGVDACFDEDLFDGLSPVVVPARALVGGSDTGEPFEVLVEPGQSVELRAEIPADRAGEWEIGCFTARGAHYRAGLEGTLRVTTGE